MRPKILHTRILKPNPKSSPTVHTKTSHSIKSVLKCASGVRGDKKDKIFVSDDKKDEIDNNINSMIEKIDVPEIEQKLSISNTKWIAPKIVTSRIVELSRTREGQVGGTWMVWLLEKLKIMCRQIFSLLAVVQRQNYNAMP